MYKYLLCWRYLKTRYIALASVISVMLGVATMIVVNAVMAGFSMIVFSFPVTFILAVIGWVIWRIFSSEINQLVACFLGLIIGLIMGAMLDRILCDEHHYFFILSGAVGLMVGYIEFYLFKLYNDEIEE